MEMVRLTAERPEGASPPGDGVRSAPGTGVTRGPGDGLIPRQVSPSPSQQGSEVSRHQGAQQRSAGVGTSRGPRSAGVGLEGSEGQQGSGRESSALPMTQPVAGSLTAGCPSKVQGSGVSGGRLLAPSPARTASSSKASAVQGREPQWPPGLAAMPSPPPGRSASAGHPAVGTAILPGAVLSSEARPAWPHPRGQWQSAPSPRCCPRYPARLAGFRSPAWGRRHPRLQRAGGALCTGHPPRLRALPHHALLLVWGGLVSALSLPDSSANETAVSGRAGRVPVGSGDSPELGGGCVCRDTGRQPRDGPGRWAQVPTMLQRRGCSKAFADEEAVGGLCGHICPVSEHVRPWVFIL